jgi:hypothetical protein
MKKVLLFLTLGMMTLSVQIVKAEETEEVSCLDPTNLQVNVSGTKAEVTWEAGGSEDGWQLILMTQAQIESREGIPTTAIVRTNSYTFNSLAPNTTYVLIVMPFVYNENQEVIICGREGANATFTTESTAIEEIVVGRSSLVDGQKILHDGHLYFLRDGKIFNAQGAQVR